MSPYATPYSRQPAYGAGMYPQYPQINYTQPPLTHILPGKSVSNVSDISPADVPMDGSIALFPKKDGSCIFVKYMNDEGLITTDIYLPQDSNVEVPNLQEEEGATNADIVDKLNTVIDLLNRKPNYNRNRNKNYKKKNDQSEETKDVTEHGA